jgi:hypothetical protein
MIELASQVTESLSDDQEQVGLVKVLVLVDGGDEEEEGVAVEAAEVGEVEAAGAQEEFEEEGEGEEGGWGGGEDGADQLGAL